MGLLDACIRENVAWESQLYTAYNSTDEFGIPTTLFCYQIPFSAEKEAQLLERYSIDPEHRMGFYRDLLICVQNSISVSAALISGGVPSILGFSNVEQVQRINGTSYIILESERVRPITQTILSETVTPITLLDIGTRLSMILRDIGMSETNRIIHRGLDMNEVFLNEQNRILLGGFYYSYSSASSDCPKYLPMRPAIVPPALIQGATGSAGTDTQMLAALLWNLFSGLPYDTPVDPYYRVFPEYANEEIAQALLMGLSCSDQGINLFRRRLQACRKLLTQMEGADIQIPIGKPKLKKVDIEYV